MNHSDNHHSAQSPHLTELYIEGMHCNHCTQTVHKTLENLGVCNISIDLSSSSALIDPGQQSVDTIIHALIKAGFPSRLAIAEPQTMQSPLLSLEAKLLISLLFTAPLLFHMLLPFELLQNQYVQLVLSLPVVLIGAQHFGTSALRSIRQGIANMDLLIFIGITSAFIYSLYGTIYNLGHNFLFYETAASITLFVLLGNYMERRSMKKTSAAVEELARLQPEIANRYDKNGAIQTIPTSQVHEGDQLLIRDGEKVPVDCSITQGTATVDESFVTGESLPITKTTGDQLIGGSVITDGSVQVRASAVGEKTVLSQIIRLVRTATSSKPAIQQLGDMVSSVFVPIVLLIALATFLIGYFFGYLSFSQSLLQAIAVLVISCPCAMGLATPTAVTVGIGRATKEGALIKGGAILERLAHIETVIFDKTGTLTTGVLQVESIETFNDTRESLLQIIKSIELHSTHPIAKIILDSLTDYQPTPLLDITEEKGHGMHARDQQGNQYLFGSARFTKQAQQDGDIFLLKNGVRAASMRIRDTIKPEVERVISDLKGLGLQIIIISGDHHEKVKSVAQTLGIERFYAEQLPAQKLELTKQLSERERTCFIGDGINDAPALAQASVGISLSGATQVAIQTADIILLDGKLNRLPELFSLSRLTLKTIKENLFWAFFYNSMAIPFAAFGFLTPLVSALAMAFSDTIVIGNSLRLKVRSIGILR